jgi:formylglycine-generating enzyme required for sulfatase activity
MRKLMGRLFKFIFRHWFVLLVFSLGVCSVFLFRTVIEYTSTDEFCESCHVHPQATSSWKLGLHRDTKSGMVAHCVDCHLPPSGFSYLFEKTKTGMRDVYGTLFLDTEKINWDQKSRREFAVKHVFKSGCIKCHQNLFPRDLDKKGQDAHLYYEQNIEKLRCINCHLEVGHFHEKKPVLALDKVITGEIFTEATVVTAFENFSEKIPGSTVSFDMVAIPGGQFKIGSRDTEDFRESDEGPQRTIEISPFWMGKTEVTWDEFETFMRQTYRGGRTEDQIAKANNSSDIQAISGPTPAYGDPSQGWGMGQRPAITMTFHAATVYCQWLSGVTGKKYRLPTEAEWEYAARANSENTFFFEGEVGSFDMESFWNKIFGTDTTINSFVKYKSNSEAQTHIPNTVKPNPFGLVHMLGNVKEFCSDWYASNSYTLYSEESILKDPKGPQSGQEHVIRGGSFKSRIRDVRLAARDYTRHDAWMVTDPQSPKSLWWYSDNNEVGIRLVCEYEGN